MTRTEMIERGIAQLQRSDPRLAPIIDRAPRFDVRPTRNRFRAIARSIVAQQISTAAAATIWQRLESALGQPATATAVAQLSSERLRDCGLSARKASYLIDLATRVESDLLPLDRLGRLDDERVIEALTAVRGIGRWTAQMFLLFGLGRLDVLAVDDFGLKSALRNLHRLEALPDRETFTRLAEPWRPFASIASWYCWRSLESTD